MLIRDISVYDNRQVNYSAYDGFIIRAVRTNGLIDVDAEYHTQQCIAAGKPFGYYMYVNFKRDIQTQINQFNSYLAAHPCAFRPAVDIEHDIYDNSVIPANLRDIVRTYLAQIHGSMLYSGTNFIKNYLGANFTNSYLWQADYRGYCEEIAGYTRIGWQYKGGPDESIFDERIYNKAPDVGFIDSPKEGEIVANTLNINGWALSDTGVERVEMYVENMLFNTLYAQGFNNRPDVQAVYPTYPDNLKCGFGYTGAAEQFTNGNHTLTIKVVSRDGTSYTMTRAIVIERAVVVVNPPTEDIPPVTPPVIEVPTPTTEIPQIDIPTVTIPQLELPSKTIPELKIESLSIPKFDLVAIIEALLKWLNLIK